MEYWYREEVKKREQKNIEKMEKFGSSGRFNPKINYRKRVRSEEEKGKRNEDKRTGRTRVRETSNEIRKEWKGEMRRREGKQEQGKCVLNVKKKRI